MRFRPSVFCYFEGVQMFCKVFCRYPLPLQAAAVLYKAPVPRLQGLERRGIPGVLGGTRLINHLAHIHILLTEPSRLYQALSPEEVAQCQNVGEQRKPLIHSVKGLHQGEHIQVFPADKGEALLVLLQEIPNFVHSH